MSGLVTFFKDFFPDIQNIDYSRSLNEITSDEFGTPSSREGSLEYTPNEWTVKEWRAFQKNSLKVYFQKRVAPEDETNNNTGDEDDERSDEDEDDDNDYETDGDEDLAEEENDDEHKEEPESQILETQQHPQQETPAVVEPSESPNQQKQKTQSAPRERRRRIPHLKQAIHVVRNKLDYLDMYTKQLTLDLCTVGKVWKLRDTKRGLSLKNVKQRVPVFPGRMPRCPYEDHQEDDGPLLSIYKHVLSLEIEPVFVTSGNGADQQIQQQPKQRRQRMKIFLYNAYAKVMNDWLKEHSLTTSDNLVMSLKNVPAICIVPFAIDPRDWLDMEELVEYTLCIGDWSSMKLVTDDEETVKVRMDSEDMEIRVASVNRRGSSSTELILSPSTVGGEFPSTAPTTLLQNAWHLNNGTDPLMRNDRPATAPNPNSSIATTSSAAAAMEGKDEIPEPTADPQPAPRQDSTRQAPAASTTTSTAATRPPPSGAMVYGGQARKRKRALESIEYISLSSLREAFHGQDDTGRKTVNLYAAVLGFTPPCQTRRGDWMMTATLIDESFGTAASTKEKIPPVTVVMFCKEIHQLPKLTRMGDVLRMHRMSLQKWKGDVQLLGKRPSSYVVIGKARGGDEEPKGGANDERWNVLPTATNAFDFTSKDEDRSQELWAWAQEWIQTKPTIHAEHCFTLAEMNEDEEEKFRDRDLTVMVTAKYPYPEESRSGVTPWGFLRVWDGTGNAPSDKPIIDTLLSHAALSNGDPPAEAMVQISSIIEKLEDAGMVKLDTPKAACGKVANVLVWEETHWKLITEHIPVGCFVRLRNVEVRRWKGNDFRSLFVHSKSWLTPLPDLAHEIRGLLEEHNKRMAREEYNPQSGLLPSNPIPMQLDKSRALPALGDGLSDFVWDTNSGKFVGIVRILESQPHFRGSYKPFCHENSGSFEYRFSVHLADASQQITALVSNTAAEKIIGMPASVAVGSKKKPNLAIIDPDTLWMAKIQSLHFAGQSPDSPEERYFLLLDLSEA